jgi:hypothetical protein
MRARSKDARQNDASAWAYAQYALTVKDPRPPTVSAIGPKELETGRPYHYKGTVRPSWGSVQSTLAITSEWVLPDGSVRAGKELDWTPSVADLTDPKPLIYRAWVEGFKSTTSSEHEINYKLWNYVWPEFSMGMKQFTVEAPSDINFTVSHKNPDMNRRFEGLTYQWAFPAGITGRPNDVAPNRAAAQALFAGEYAVTVTIRDTRGHETRLTQRVVAEQAAPYGATLKVGKSNTYNRVPMTVTVKPAVFGGHPLDSVASQTWKVDGVTVNEYENRSIMVSDITDAGNHVISYTLNSKMGGTTTVSSPLALIHNQLPVCQLSAKPNAYAVHVEAKCTDPDGKVVGYSWSVNGEPIGSTSYRISFSKANTAQSASVGIKAMDDSGEQSTPVSMLVNY